MKEQRASEALVKYLETEFGGIAPLEVGDAYTIHVTTESFVSIYVDYGDGASGKFIVPKEYTNV